MDCIIAVGVSSTPSERLTAISIIAGNGCPQSTILKLADLPADVTVEESI
jgi:hypothetical protein